MSINPSLLKPLSLGSLAFENLSPRTLFNLSSQDLIPVYLGFHSSRFLTCFVLEPARNGEDFFSFLPVTRIETVLAFYPRQADD